jgi:hypothetical protein
VSRFRILSQGVAPRNLSKSAQEGDLWVVAYHHSIRTDEAGIKFVPDQAEAAAKAHGLEALGYIIAKIEEIPPSGLAAIDLSP